jgi:hypothetical protein
MYYSRFDDISDDTLSIIYNIMGNIIFDGYLENKYPNTFRNFSNRFLKLFINNLHGDDKTKMILLHYQIISKLNDYSLNVKDYNGMDKSSKDLIILLINEQSDLGNKLKDKLKKELYSIFIETYTHEDIYKIIGQEIMYNELLCPLTLKFPCGNTLKVNQMLFPFFDCFQCDGLEGEHECDYDYECMKYIVTYFFTGICKGKYSVENFVKILLEINRMGFNCKFSQLAKYLVDLIFNNADNILPVLFKNNTFENFLSQNEIILNMLIKYSESEFSINKDSHYVSKILNFLKTKETEYDIMEFLTSSCYINHICMTVYGKKYINENNNFLKLPITIFQYPKVILALSDNNKEFIGLKYENFDYLVENKLINNKIVVDLLPEEFITNSKIFTLLTNNNKIKLGLKYKNFQCINDSLQNISNINNDDFKDIAKLCKQFDPQNYQKWTYLENISKKTVVNVTNEIDVKKNNKFIYIHSLNPFIEPNVNVFTLVGTVVGIISIDNKPLGIIIKINYLKKLTVNTKIFIGDKYNNDSHLNITQMKELYICPDKINLDVSYKVDYLQNYDKNNIQYGKIFFNDPIDVTIGSCIFINKQL